MVKTEAIFIRRAIPKDALAIKQIHNKAYQISYKGFLPDEFLDSLHIDDDIINRTQKYLTQAECYIATIENKIVGFLYISYPEKDIFELQALYIHPEYQKQGIGTALITNVCNLKNKQYKKCVVWTMKYGPSLNFYKKQGFSFTSNEKIWKFDIPIVMLEKNI